MTDWQPIETAPRDGTEIMAVTIGSLVVIVRRHNNEWLSREWGTWRKKPKAYVYGDATLTHWMLLPEPPK